MLERVRGIEMSVWNTTVGLEAWSIGRNLAALQAWALGRRVVRKRCIFKPVEGHDCIGVMADSVAALEFIVNYSIDLLVHLLLETTDR